jgi:hypothetical protein
MHELTALARFAFNQNRWTLRILIATVIAGQLITAMMFLINAYQADGTPAVVPSLSVLWPAGLTVFVLFNFTPGVHLVGPASDCSHWLLRMPIASWKIAVVPVFLKTAWISIIWLLAVLVVAWASSVSKHDVHLPLVTPCLLFSAAAIWLMVIAWLPVYAGWTACGRIGMSGRLWFAGLITIDSAAACIIPFAYFLVWFRNQSDWAVPHASGICRHDRQSGRHLGCRDDQHRRGTGYLDPSPERHHRVVNCAKIVSDAASENPCHAIDAQLESASLGFLPRPNDADDFLATPLHSGFYYRRFSSRSDVMRDARFWPPLS